MITSLPAVELSDVTKRFKDTTALQNVSLRVDPGEVIAILGPNGAGKTTAINIMLGIRKPTSGEARVFGMAPQDLRARSMCGVMLQETGLPWNLRVEELVELFRTYYPDPLPTAEIVETAGLTYIASVRSGDLSGGQRQRLAFALAICGNPSLLFLDEPSVGLDVDSRRTFWQAMQRFARSGKTIVMTTHYMEEADALANRIIVINDGRLIADESPAAIKTRAHGKHVSLTLARGVTPDVFDGLPVSDLDIRQGRTTFVTASPEETLRSLWGRNVGFGDVEIRGAALDEAVSALTTSDKEDQHADIA